MVRAWRHRRPDARHHRGDVMWPWEPPGTSVATGILDDEAYDWAAVLDALERTGGTAITVTEDELRAANERGRRGDRHRGQHRQGRRGSPGSRPCGARAPSTPTTPQPYCSPDDGTADPVRGLVVRRRAALARRPAVVLRLHTHRVVAIDDAGEGETIVEVPERPSGLGWLPDGRLLVVSMLDRKVLRLEPDGRSWCTPISAASRPVPCNDMVVDAHGRAYVGNFGFDMYRRRGAAQTCASSRSSSPTARVHRRPTSSRSRTAPSSRPTARR